jgi:hypothetical protein
MRFWNKVFITLWAIRKNTYALALGFILASVISCLTHNLTVYKVCLPLSIIMLSISIIIPIVCLLHRKSCIHFKVYLSFSESYNESMARYISDYLNYVLWYYNISSYDFRQHPRYHYLDWPHICAEIDRNLADSDIFVRFVSEELPPGYIIPVNRTRDFIRLNPFTREIDTVMPAQYQKYEIDTSYDRFGFTNRNNRFQIVGTGVNAASMPHISTIWINPEQSALDFALIVTNAFINGYKNQMYRKSIDLLWQLESKRKINDGGF